MAGAITVVAAAEWLYGLDTVWTWVAGAAGVLAAALALRPPRRLLPLAAGGAALVTGLILLDGTRRIHRIECCWPALRASRLTADSGALRRDLTAAVREARRLAAQAAAAAWRPQPRAFQDLAAVLTQGPSDLERGVVVLESDGVPYAWAGRHRVDPAAAPDTAELRAVISPFYVTLEARRQAANGRRVVASVLLDAAPAVADRQAALAVRFAARHGVTLRFTPAAAPLPDSGEFTFCPESCAAAAGLFNVRAVAPSQGDAKLAALAVIAGRLGVTLLVTLVLLLLAAPAGRWRWLVALTAAWTAARGLFGPATRPPALFSPATFYRPLLGEFSDSTGSLLAIGLLILLASAALWRRGPGRRWWSYPIAGLLLLYAPYLVRYLGRGIAPPAAGVSFTLWLSWEAALATASMALVLLAAAVVRGRSEPTRVPWTLPAACAWAVVAAILGLWLWSPSGAWPEWYTFLWLPALAGVIVPAPRRYALLGIAVVAGTAAALVTWGAAVEGRLALAARDAQQLGGEPDPLAVAELERLGRLELGAPAPASAADLYALWAGSPLATEDYPTVLATWTPRGDEIAELRLAAVDLPTSLLALLAQGAPGAGIHVEAEPRIPGVHYVLTTPLADSAVLTVGVGPRSRLVPASRLARFLQGEQAVEPPYTISLSLPLVTAEPGRVVWSRTGWVARGDRQLDLPGGPRHVHVRVDLRGPWILLVRGVLVVLCDLALLAAAWLLSRFVADGWLPRPTSPRRVWSSFRGRFAIALAAFFITPVLAFAVWSLARLGDTVRSSDDLLIRQALRDATASAGEPPPASPQALTDIVVDLGRRLDADLWTYRGGELAGTSAAVLAQLGLVDPFLSPSVYRSLALEDELEVTVDTRTAGRPTRVGYRVMVAGAPEGQVVLAAPQLLDDEAVRRQQEDLALVLLLATVAGLVAAGGLAGLTARTLTRPVAALREAALAVGRGQSPPPFPPNAPRELAPVLQAFDRMVHDVGASQSALEDARRRTAQVLAKVATGVVAVDGQVRITIANARAAELLGAALEPGTAVATVTGSLWAPVWNAVRQFLAVPTGAIAEREFQVGERDIRVQLAPLGAAGDGCVVALDDTTALARAARVLAWGEMARQVAHEIKNPLTPIRLGIQHLERAYRGAARREFDRTLQETSRRILDEIDRLDTIARAFSRFGAPAAEQAPLEPVDLHGLAREVVQLYALSETAGARVVLAGASGRLARARRDEVKEVLVNLVENSRNAGAREVRVVVDGEGLQVAVHDDGPGIPPESQGRVFEPTFSTTSSGSGLGLAIARRLVESWGGTITLTSELGRGTVVRLALAAALQAGAT